MKLIAPILLALSLASVPAIAQDGGAAVSDAAAASVDAAPAPAVDAAPAAVVETPTEPAPPVASEAPSEPNAATALLDTAVDILLPLLLLVALWASRKVVSFTEKKTGIDIPAGIEAQIDKWVEQGIGYAAEKAHQKAKEGTAKLTGPEKLESAADFVMTFVKAKGWDDWAKDAIEKKIEAKLGESRDA